MDVDVNDIRIITEPAGIRVVMRGVDEKIISRAEARILGLALMEAADE